MVQVMTHHWPMTETLFVDTAITEILQRLEHHYFTTLVMLSPGNIFRKCTKHKQMTLANNKDKTEAGDEQS